MSWDHTFMWIATWSITSLPITLSLLIGNYIVEYNYQFSYFITPYFGAVLLVEIGILIGCFLAAFMVDGGNLDIEN